MKILKLLAMLFVAVTMCFVTSCSKDDDDDKDDKKNSELVGTWRDSYDGDWDEITFKSDGTYIWTWHEEGKSDDVDRGTYIYNHPDLKFYDKDGDLLEHLYVKSISSSLLVLNDSDDEEYGSYKKR